MAMSMAAVQAKGKKLKDVIFAANSAAQADIKINGKEAVVNGTIGAILDEEGEIIFLETVRKEYLSLPKNEYVAYAPIAGLPDYLEAVYKACFDEFRPDAFIDGVATAGGTGGIHHLIHNYTAEGDQVLTADWYWGNYNTICKDEGRSLTTFTMLTDDLIFNVPAFKEAVSAIAEKQETVSIILNSPGNNPTGFSIKDQRWDKIIEFLKELVSNGKNKVVLGVDVAYLDYSGDKKETRRFFKKFSNLPKEILVVVCYSLSKGFTMYGQRMGAMIGISSDKDVIEEFHEINVITSRATWSNLCRPAQRTMANIVNDPVKFASYEAEREECNQLVSERAHIFSDEAAQLGLPIVPYLGGFFLTIPTEKAAEVCEALQKHHVYVVPLAKGIRVAACSIPKRQMKGLATTIYKVMKEHNAL